MTHDTTVTWADYARAERFLPANATKLIFNAAVAPHWIAESDRFWYRRTGRDGAAFVLVDPATGRSEPAFDHVRLAAALSEAAGSHHVHTALPFETFSFENDEQAIRFDAADKPWMCDLTTYDCVPGEKEEKDKTEVRSPDGRWAAFVRDDNLFVREIATGEERQITTDGKPYHAYAALPGSSLSAVTDRVIGKPATPALQWSPNSTKFVTYRLDERKVRDMHLLQSVPTDGSARPVLHAYRYPLVGDEQVPLAHLLVVAVESGSVIPLKIEPLATMTRTTPFEQRNVWWSGDSTRVYAISQRRGHRSVALQIADAATGKSGTVLEEHGPSHVYPHHVPMANTNVHEVGNSEAVTWWSQRSGWGHLSLYDVATGKMKAQLTAGAWTVRDTVRVDAEHGWVFFTAGGREQGRDPYFRHLYRCTLDGTDPTLLTPEDADHSVTFSPSGAYFVDTWSRVDVPPVSVVRKADGTLVAKLEEADITALTEMGWRFPERFTVKARDGVTDLYGCLFRPTNYDATRRYPVLDSIYPGPQIIHTPKVFGGGDTGGRNFWQDQALAELGFLVVNIDGMGTPYRSKAFVDVAYGARFGEAGGLEDHIAGLTQLAARDRSLDLDRVGIYGHSGGGFASAHALLAFPDFYKVAVSSAGNHNQMGYLAGWGERYIGMPEGDNYAGQINASLAKNLKGKLLLVHGEMDDNVHPSLTMQLADALIAANKDFDLLIIPFTNHGFFDLRWGLEGADRFVSLSHPYFVRKRWDYFVTHLLGATPPAGYAIAPLMAASESRKG
ncbi:MAG: S9 family peptidase [Thermomicrobiales bacterium]